MTSFSLPISLRALEQSSAGDSDVWSCPAPRGAVLAFAKLRLGDFTVIWEERALEQDGDPVPMEVGGNLPPPAEASPAGASPAEAGAHAWGGLDAAWVICGGPRAPHLGAPHQAGQDLFTRRAPAKVSKADRSPPSSTGARPRTGLRDCQAQIDAALATLRIPAELKPWVRFYGGSAFTEGRDGSGCWADFGEATFVLPRFVYVDHPAGAQLLVVACRSAPSAGHQQDLPEQDLPEQDSDAEAWRQNLLLGARRCLEVLFEESALGADACAPDARGPGSPVEPPAAGDATIEVLARQTSASQAEFGSLVEAARASISVGVVSKVVTARRVTLTLSAAPDVHLLLARLRRDASACTRFLLRIRERTFVGATPELLVQKDGLALRTEALAGTAALTADIPPEQICRSLLESQKNQHEHGFVVRAIQSVLAPLCVAIHVPSAPAIRRLSHLVHLWTPITAKLAQDLPLLSLVGYLHPTPAVGGLPRDEAVCWIESHETTERGWYASPFGFVDAAGNGQFVVALRSALLHRDRVHLFAGAGIVAESDPTAEFAETELKLGAMERALGIA